MPELLAAEYPLRFMNLRGAYTVGYVSLIFDKLAIGHCAWATYYLIKATCLKDMTAEHNNKNSHEQGKFNEKPEIMTIYSAEILAASPKKTGSMSLSASPSPTKASMTLEMKRAPNTTYGRI